MKRHLVTDSSSDSWLKIQDGLIYAVITGCRSKSDRPQPTMSTLVETRLPGPFNILQSSLQKDFARETDAVFPQLTNKTESTHQDAPSNGHESSSSTPTAFQQFQNAVTITVDRTYEVVTNFPAPQTLAPHEVLIRTKAVGLNHIDWKSVKYNYCLPASPWITGREMAGIVERIGCGVSHVEVGERVWTSKCLAHSGLFVLKPSVDD